MSANAIFLPALALMGWTFVVLTMILWRRVGSARAGEVDARDFRYGESARVPDRVRLPNRVYMNLLELPIIYYALTLIFFVTGNVDETAVVLGWTYVLLRVAHSLITLTYNNVFHRLAAFACSNVVVLALWLKLVVRIVA